jgi:hypothetical protein
MTRYLIPFAMVLGFLAVGLDARVAEAGVKGKTYNVTVTKNFSREFRDFYLFNQNGTFLSVRGGKGQWGQVNLLLFSIWTADFEAARNIRVSFIGVQVGPNLSGFGSNGQGDIFQTVGTEGPFNGSFDDDTNLYIVD